SAETRRVDDHVGARTDQLEPLPERRRLVLAPQPFEALDEPVKGPHVVGVLQGAGYPRGDAQVVCVDLEGLLYSTLFPEKRAQSGPDRLHPSPWLVVRQVVRKLYRVSKARERSVVFALPVLELAVQHRRRDPQDV